MTFKIAALAVAVAAHPAVAGVTLTWELPARASEPGGKPRMITVQVEGQKARVGPLAAGQQFMVWDAEAKVLTTVRPADQTYRRMTEQDMVALKQNLDQMKKLMEQRLAAMPADKRAQYQSMLGEHGMAPPPPGPWKFTALGKKLKVSAWDCELYAGVRGEQKSEVCVVPWAKAPLKLDELKPLLVLGETVRSFGPVAGPDSAGGESLEQDLAEFPGMPVQVSRPQADGSSRVMTLKSVGKGALAAEVFAVPSGYAEQKLPAGPRAPTP